jgi:hypothetical protein
MEEFSNSLFEQTVLARPEQLQILPENILSLVHNYNQGKLTPTSTDEVSILLKGWFEGTLTKENVFTSDCSYTPCDIDVGLESSTRQKRQRVACDI